MSIIAYVPPARPRLTLVPPLTPQQGARKDPQLRGPLLTVAEAAEQLGCSRARIYQLMGAGLLVSVEAGRRRYIAANSVEQLLDAEE